MKLSRSEWGDGWVLAFTKDSFIHTVNEWGQLRGGFNWYTFHPIHIMLENDKMTGGFEFEVVVLGLGLRYRWNYNPAIMNGWTKKVSITATKSKRGKKK